MFHLLFPRKELADGLKMIALDTDCKQITQCVAERSVAEIYVDQCPNYDSDVELVTTANDSSESDGDPDEYVPVATSAPTNMFSNH